jgi:hypothetical protein
MSSRSINRRRPNNSNTSTLTNRAPLDTGEDVFHQMLNFNDPQELLKRIKQLEDSENDHQQDKSIKINNRNESSNDINPEQELEQAMIVAKNAILNAKKRSNAMKSKKKIEIENQSKQQLELKADGNGNGENLKVLKSTTTIDQNNISSNNFQKNNNKNDNKNDNINDNSNNNVKNNSKIETKEVDSKSSSSTSTVNNNNDEDDKKLRNAQKLLWNEYNDNLKEIGDRKRRAELILKQIDQLEERQTQLTSLLFIERKNKWSL